MPLADFIAAHVPALEADEPRHNLVLAILGRAARADAAPLDLATWSLGRPGACAVRTPGRSILLGAPDRSEARALAEATRQLSYPGVAGPGDAPHWFVERAGELGIGFAPPQPQRIHALTRPPAYPGCAGSARAVGPADAALLADWLAAFMAEAVPHDPVPTRAELEREASERRHLLWVVDSEPVAMAGIVRRTRSVGVVAAVYTPPRWRGRGYAGAVTAAVVERIFASGKTAACLYTDLANPASNRCYAKIGFVPVCDAWLYLREERSE